jgi:hypothetical protein
MKCRMEEHPSGSDESEEIVTPDMSFEANTMGHTPSMGEAANPLSIRSVAEDAEHRLGVADVTQRPNSQSTSLPRKQPTRENNILAARSDCTDFAYFNRGRVRQHRQVFVGRHASGGVVVLSENYRRSLARQARRPDPY